MMSSMRFVTILLLLLMSLTVQAAPSVKAIVKPLPNPPDVGDNELQIHLTDASGKALDGAICHLLVSMSAMGTMPRMDERATVTAKGGGDYIASYQIPMSGSWEMTLDVEYGAGQRSFRYSITTGIPDITDQNVRVGDGTGPTNVMDIGPRRLQMIGVRFAMAKRTPLQRIVRAVGVVEQDKTHREDVTVRYAGYIAKLFTGRVGDLVAKGQPLFSIYSPELVTAQSEYLLAAKSGGGSHALLAAAEDRLRNLGMSATQVAALKRTRKPQRDIVVRSAIKGTVLEVDIGEGSAVSAGQSVIQVGDLSKTYIVARVFQQDVQDIRAGQVAEIALPSVPGETYKGRVDLVFPQIEPGAGTANVRVQAIDPVAAASLKPGAYVDLRFPVRLGERLAIPVDALLYSGLHNYVFVDRGEGVLEPREVFPGETVGDLVVIRKGLSPGERVAASGTFLLSSEAQLRSALPKWSSQQATRTRSNK